MDFANRNNFTLYPDGDFSKKCINNDLIKSLNNTQIEKYENEILSIVKNQKSGVLGKNKDLFDEYFSESNMNTSNKNKSQVYNNIINADLIENSINETFLEELGKF